MQLETQIRKEERNYGIDLLRIIAMYIIVLHVSASKWYDTPVKDFNWQIYNLYDSLVRWAVPIFVMLSGMFFLNPEKFIPTSNIIKKYIYDYKEQRVKENELLIAIKNKN